MDLSNLQPNKGSLKSKKRIGRGEGSGHGGTSTRGHKGAKSRSGYKSKLGFEGGQMPLQRRVPKFGFKNRNRVQYQAINLNKLVEISEKLNTNKIDVNCLIENRYIKKNELVKVLAFGKEKFEKALEVEVHQFSKEAEKVITEKGGKAITCK